MPAPRTAEEAFTRYIFLRTVSRRGRIAPPGPSRRLPDQGSIQQALTRLVDQPEHAESNPGDDEAVVGELRGIAGRDTGPAELLTLSAAAAAALYRATSEQAGRP